MIYLIDTNIFLRTFIKENPDTFSDCSHFLQLVKRNKVEAVTTGIVLAEIVWTLSFRYKVPRDQIFRRLDSLINLHGLKIIDQYNYRAAADLFAVSSAKYVDCLLATIDEVAKGLWAIVSYDKDFDKLKVKHLEPKEVILKLENKKAG